MSANPLLKFEIHRISLEQVLWIELGISVMKPLTLAATTLNIKDMSLKSFS
jgi:hypothetical protein